MKVEVWSDVVCPWCYIGKRRLEAAVAGFGEAVEVEYHAFELDPNAPRRSSVPIDQMLAKKYGLSPQRVAELQAHVTATAAQEGLAFRLGEAVPENTFDAHRLIALAKVHGRQLALTEALMDAYFARGGRVGDPATLRGAAVGVGVPPEEVDAVLADPARFADEVRADQAQARRIGVRGVPFFVVDGKFGVSGAQPVAVLRGALDRARAERPSPVADGPACEGDACAVPAAAPGE